LRKVRRAVLAMVAGAVRICCCGSSPNRRTPDGDWPQWFMFFDRGTRGIRPGDSHGDIVFWRYNALAQ